MTENPNDAQMELGQWFAKLLDELDEDSVDDPVAVGDLQGRFAQVLTDWRVRWGYGSARHRHRPGQ